jgi:hypothetical protein
MHLLNVDCEFHQITEVNTSMIKFRAGDVGKGNLHNELVIVVM